MTSFPHKLGKKAPVIDARTLRLAKYLDAAPVLPAPASVDWTKKVTAPWGVMLNDRLGDCTCAAAGHLVLAWMSNALDAGFAPSDGQVLSLYEGSCGYNPDDPSTDQGGVEIEVLKFWRKNGIGDSGHKIAAFVSVNPKNFEEVQQAIALFGGIYIGVALPTSAQEQVGGLWAPTSSTPGDAGSWGGHAIPIVAYTPDDLTAVTWGALQKLTWAWLEAYCDEAYAIVTHDWIEANRKSPSGLNVTALELDLRHLG